MKKLARVAVGASLCLALGSPALAKKPAKGGGDPKCSVRVTSIPESPKRGGASFSASEIVDLNFEVRMKGRRTVDWVVLRVLTPEGHLYQTFEVPVSEEGEEKRGRKVRGYPFPLKVSRPKAEGGKEKAKARDHKGPPRWYLVDAPPFPVAGTHITTHSLYGKWQVEAWPEGSGKGCKARFRIRR